MNLKLIYFLFVLSFFLHACQNTGADRERSGAAQDTTMALQTELNENEEEVQIVSFSYTERKGKLVFDKYCTVCHGATGEGDGFNAYNLEPKPKDLTEEGYLATLSDTWLFEVIGQGGRGVKRSVLMPSYEKTLTESQIQDLVDYLRVLPSDE